MIVIIDTPSLIKYNLPVYRRAFCQREHISPREYLGYESMAFVPE